MTGLRTTTFVAVLLAAHAHVASAQAPTSTRPYRGLFGADQRQMSESLTVTGSTGAGWDSSVATDADLSTVSGGQLPALRGAGYSMASGSIAYGRSTRAIELSVGGTTTNRYYSSFAEPLLGAHAGTASLRVLLRKSTSLNVTQSVAHQPVGLLNAFPGQAPGGFAGFDLQVAASPSLDLRAQRQGFTTTSSALTFDQGVSKRASVSLISAYQRATFGGEDGVFSSRMVGARFTYVVAKGLDIRLGYSNNEARWAQPGTEPFKNHQIESGLNFARALSFSRRTTVGFDTGTTAFRFNGREQYFVVGGAMLAHEIGRTWTLASTYRRAVTMVPTFDRPFFSDVVGASFGGQMSRRVQLATGVGLTSGVLGIQAADTSGMWAYYGQSNLGIALSKYFNLTAGYNYYSFDLNGSTYSALGFPGRLNRHSLTVFMSTWAPIIQKGRRNNASR